MSNLIRTIQQVTRDYVDSISHRIPSIKNGAVTATSSDGTATVRVDGDAATTGSVPSIAAVKTGDRVKMLLFNRQLTILGAIQRTDKFCPFPIGYIVTNQGEDPSTHWPGTSWERYAEGRVLVGQDTGQTEFNTIGKTGGAKTHTLTVAQMPAHDHDGSTEYSKVRRRTSGNQGTGSPEGAGASFHGASDYRATIDDDYTNHRHTISSSGGGAAHNNLQPYVVVAHWRRTA